MVVWVGSGAVAPVDGDLGVLYAGNAVRVRRLVRHYVRAPAPIIEDACQTAWSRLVGCQGSVRHEAAVAWLVTTAMREVVRATRRTGREMSYEELMGDACEELAGDPDAPAPYVDPAPGPEALVQQRARLDALRSLPPRQRRLIWLQALGFDYDEMARATGATWRTVDRQLVRARRRLRELDPG